MLSWMRRRAAITTIALVGALGVAVAGSRDAGEIGDRDEVAAVKAEFIDTYEKVNGVEIGRTAVPDWKEVFRRAFSRRVYPEEVATTADGIAALRLFPANALNYGYRLDVKRWYFVSVDDDRALVEVLAKETQQRRPGPLVQDVLMRALLVREGGRWKIDRVVGSYPGQSP